MGRHWWLTVTTRFCLMAVFSKSLGPKWLTLADTAAWHLTVQGSEAVTTTSTSWVGNCSLNWQLFLGWFLTILTLLAQVSPTIAGSGPDGSTEEVTVTLSSPTSLLCEAQSYPPALITWLRDGRLFESSNNVRILPGLTLGMTIKMGEFIQFKFMVVIPLSLLLPQVGEHCRFSMQNKRMLGGIPAWPPMRLERQWSTMRSRFWVRVHFFLLFLFCYFDILLKHVSWLQSPLTSIRMISLGKDLLPKRSRSRSTAHWPWSVQLRPSLPRRYSGTKMDR